MRPCPALPVHHPIVFALGYSQSCHCHNTQLPSPLTFASISPVCNLYLREYSQHLHRQMAAHRYRH